jgi:hypothetical protein
MARQRTIEVSLLNVTTADPSPEKYQEIIRVAFNLRRPVKVRGSEHMILERVERANDHGIIRGRFARFTEIDIDMPWFDLENLGAAQEDSVEQINIPQHLRPNYSSFFFEFDSRKHLFTFETRGHAVRVSPHQVEKFIRKLFERAHPAENVYVNLIADQASIERIFKLDQIEYIHIHLELPNPDSLEEVEGKLKERMRSLNVKSLDETYRAADRDGIQPDIELHNVGTVASANGSVEAKGMEGGRKIKVSTKDFPLQTQRVYDPDLTTEEQAFSSAAQVAKQRRATQLADLQQRQEN